MPRHPYSARIRLCALLLVIAGSGGGKAGADGFEWIGKIELEAQGLQSSQETKRREAVSALGRYDISLTLRYLLPALSDSDPRVRLEAGRILGRNKVAQATPIIIEWLNDPESTTKQETAGILAEIGTEEAAAALIRTLGDPDDTVRQRAAKALGAIGTPQVVVPLIGRLEDDKAEVRKAAIVELERIGDRRAVIPLVGAFNDPSLDARKAAISAVGRLGDPSPIPALLRLLRDPAEDIKQAAVTSLGNLAAVPAVDRLIEELAQGSDGYRGKVAYALGQIAMRASEDDATRAHAELAVRALVEGLAVRRLRSAASEGLRHAGRAAVPGLVAHLQGEIDGDLVSAVELLRDIGDARATPALVVELERGRLPPALLLEALSKTGDQAALVPILGLLSAKDETVRLAAMTALRPIIDDRRAADVVAKRLADPSPEIRILAAEYLGLMRSRSATPALIKLIAADEKPELRQAAIDALGEIGDARAAGALMDILEKGPAALHPGAASALIYIGEPALAPRLIALGADAGSAARAEAVRALGGIFRDHPEPTVREVLERLASDADLRLSLAAIEALGAMGDARSRAALVALLTSHGHNDSHRRRAAATALGNLGDRAAAAVLIAALDASDDRVSGDAAWALGKLGDEDALPALLRATRRRGWATAINASAALARYAPAARQDDLITLLYHKSRLVRVNAAMGLGRLGSESARKPLLSALHKDPSWLVRVAAARALSRIGNAADALHRAGTSDRDQTVRDAVRMLQANRFIPPERSDWRSFQVVDPDSGDAPVRQEAYFLIAADGIATALYTDARGMSGEEEFPPGSYILEPRARESRY